MTEFLAMGGYAAYVWPAYAVSGIVLGGFTFDAFRRYRRAVLRLDILRQRQTEDFR
jgi:heme exporter protein D